MPDDQPKAAPTLEDVANAVGMSTATVSRCLNDTGIVSEGTRKKVMAAVQALGYTPNYAAKAMAAKRSYTIGAIIPTMENAVFAQGVQAFQEALHAKGYTLLVSSSAYQPELEEAQIRTLVSRGADGLLLIGADRDPEVYEFLRQRGVPAVLAWTYAPAGPIPSVGFDNQMAMQALADTVLDAGHRDIAMIAAETAENDRARARVQGVRLALTSRGLKLRVIETPYGIDTGAAAFRDLMTDGRRPTAVMCGSDVLAVGAMRAARELGLDVPGDVSITGFDDMDLARLVTPALTTVQVPHWKMGEAAAIQLIEMVEGDSAGRSVQLATQLIRRDSLGFRGSP